MPQRLRAPMAARADGRAIREPKPIRRPDGRTPREPKPGSRPTVAQPANHRQKIPHPPPHPTFVALASRFAPTTAP